MKFVRYGGPSTGQKINAGHQTLSGKNEPMSGLDMFLLDIVSGREVSHYPDIA